MDAREIPLHSKLLKILKSILRKSNYISLDGKKPFLYPDPLKKKGCFENHKPNRYLGKIMSAIGKPGFTRIHWLRHSFAAIISKERGIEFTRIVLGHASIKTTQRYIHYDRDYLQENLNKIEALDRIFR